MRKNILLPLVAALALGSTAAFAVLDTSHHDMTTYQADDQLCWQCHGRTDTNDPALLGGDFGTVGGLCLGRCHSGSGVVPINDWVTPWAPDYPQYTDSVTAGNVAAAAANTDILAFDLGAHSNVPSNLLDPYDLATDIGTASVAGTGWPYSGAAAMECSTCHAVHDNANTPFIWDTFTGGAFCVRCHTGRSTNNLTAAPDGNHPVNFIVASANAAARTLAPSGAAAGRNGRRISIDQAAPGKYFDTATNGDGALNNSGKADANSYKLGGKLDTFTTWANDGTETLSCYTCHAVHSVAYSNMIVAPWTSEAAAVGQNPICMGCHGGATTVADNYAYSFGTGNVGVTNFGHGVNAEAALTGGVYVTSVGNFTIAVTNPGVPSVWGPAATGEVMCSSCHDIHGGRDNIVIATMPDPICNACHDGSGLPDVADVSEAGAGEGANAHHRTSTAAFAVGTDGDDLNLPAAASWLAAETGNAGDLSDGLQCADCHINNGTAHNW